MLQTKIGFERVIPHTKSLKQVLILLLFNKIRLQELVF